MSVEEHFQQALESVKAVADPSPQVLLKLYGLYKQSTAGDVQGKRPGMLDMRGRAKYDAWSAQEGTSQEDAMIAYVEYVEELLGG